MTEVGTSWGPETGILYKFSPKWRAKYLEDLRYEVDSTYKTIRYGGAMAKLSDEEWEEFQKEHPATINIFYKYRPNDSEEPYYIYVVY